jgi:glyceraldehyde-3-phosphate dehydrogenase/erythrose-4-phosphate dehydrogenase
VVLRGTTVALRWDGRNQNNEESQKMQHRRIVHVVGTGTIGEPLIGLLASFRKELGIDEITFHKRTPLLTDKSKVLALQNKGANLAVDSAEMEKFSAMGMKPRYEAAEAIDRAAVVVDCTPAGNENKQKLYLRYGQNAHGFIAQGSEFGFGKMYARGINDRVLRHGEDKFLHVVSCNTHNLAVLVDAIALGPEGDNNLERGVFVCMRRASDISQENEYLPAPTVSRHDDRQFGTHQARDAFHLFATLGLDLNLYSSALRVNTQYMHVIYFNLLLKRGVALDDVIQRLQANGRVALTYKDQSSLVFSFGRDHGLFGRILSQTVIPIRSISVRDDHEALGFSFTPQDGNSLLSSIAAAEWFLYPEDYNERLQCIENHIFQEI